MPGLHAPVLLVGGLLVGLLVMRAVLLLRRSRAVGRGRRACGVGGGRGQDGRREGERDSEAHGGQESFAKSHGQFPFEGAWD